MEYVIVGLVICLLGSIVLPLMLFRRWRTSSGPRVQTIYRDTTPPHAAFAPPGLKVLGTLMLQGEVFVCPQCYLVSSRLQRCPNHDTNRVMMQKGSIDQLVHYRDMQDTLHTDIPE